MYVLPRIYCRRQTLTASKAQQATRNFLRQVAAFFVIEVHPQLSHTNNMPDKTTHGVGTDQGGGSKAPRKENGGGGKGAKKDSASLGAKKPKTTTH